MFVTGLVIAISALVGAGFSGDGFGFVTGGLLGYLLLTSIRSRRRLDKLEAAQREAWQPKPSEHSTLELPPDEPEVEEPFIAKITRSVVKPEVATTPAEVDPFDSDRSLPLLEPEPPEGEPEVESGGHDLHSMSLAELLAPARAYLFGGNTVARVGVLVLLVGVGLLGRYAAEHSMLPIELRLAGAVALGLGLVVVGWKLRLRRRGYGLLLQGGGIGAVYLTIFFAFRTYELLPQTLAFALLVVLSIASGALSIGQNAKALIFFAAGGGFLAPILASSGGGSHVALFGYYAVLNALIVGVAYARAWRELNLLGFGFTFGVATVWGALRYESHLFASTEPFLVLFFLFYVAVAVLFARKQGQQDGKPDRSRRVVDGTIVFGTPLAVFGYQVGLVRDIPFGLAWTCVAMAAVYLLLASRLLGAKKPTSRPLAEAFVALGIGFATLAIPFALDNHRLTGASWALEGAGLFWFGVRQRRLLSRLAGVALQLGAGIAFAVSKTSADTLVFVNGTMLGAVLIALSALFIAAYANRHGESLKAGESNGLQLLLLWGLLWWFGAWFFELHRELSTNHHLVAFFVVAILTAVSLEAVGRAIIWLPSRLAALLVWPASFVALVAMAAGGFHHPTADGGYAAWPLALATFAWLLRRQDYDLANGIHKLLHASMVWLVAALVAWQAWWLADQLVGFGHTWQTASSQLALALVLLALLWLNEKVSWPFAQNSQTYHQLGFGPPAVVVLAWCLLTDVSLAGESWPLPDMPLLNPLDVAQGFVWLALLTWLARSKRELAVANWIELKGKAAVVLGFSSFVWLNAVLARSVHLWADVAYVPRHLWRSVEMQTTLSIAWTLAALVVMVVANRRLSRTAWFVAAALLGIVVLKLFMSTLR